MNLPDAPIAHEGFFATHFFTVRDQEKSKDFYVRILGGKLIKPENPCYIKLANTWIILNCGGGPTPDKPEVLLETPSDLNTVSSFLNLRVADIRACYKQGAKKARSFLRSRCRIPTAGNGAATCVIPTATSSRSANILNSRLTGSTNTVNLASDKQEDVPGFLGSAHEVIRYLVRRATKSGDIRRGLDSNDLLRALVGVSNVASGPLLARFFEDRPHKDTTNTFV